MITLAETLADLGVAAGGPVTTFRLGELRAKFAAIEADDVRRIRTGKAPERAFHAVALERTPEGVLVVSALPGPVEPPPLAPRASVAEDPSLFRS